MQFIAVDADISQISQEFLNLLRVEYKLIKNTFQNFKNQKNRQFPIKVNGESVNTDIL